MTAPPSSSSSSSSSSPPPLRYVPQGFASLSSDAPGWSSTVLVGGREERAGPICWKCRGQRFLAAVSACRRSRRQKSNQEDDYDDESSAAIVVDESNKDSSRRRSCPICAGSGHLPIKLKYRQSITTELTGAITPRRRRRREHTNATSRQIKTSGWVEFGHIPGAVLAALEYLRHANDEDNDEVNAVVSPMYDKDAMMRYAINLLSQACRLDDDDDVTGNQTNSHVKQRKDIPVSASMAKAWKEGNQIPLWLPTNPGEQLCNLVGHWRILQRKASHRWTTDDIVTAYIAASTFVSFLSTTTTTREDYGDYDSSSTLDAQKIRYLDLGTGNASVLQMVTWYLLSSLSSSSSSTSRGRNSSWKQAKLEAAGVEARSEAVNLARRSLSFNLDAVKFDNKMYYGGVVGGDDNNNSNGREAMLVDSTNVIVQIIHGDFRELVSLAADSLNKEADGLWSMEDVASKRYDLITGTPPYFRVGFTTTSKTQGMGSESMTDDDCEVVTSAVIEQGGMPTSMQSAPARCEFRGGIEAYCLAASALLSTPYGKFVVCENWANDDRVWMGATKAGLTIESVWPVSGGGKQRQGNILFAVYVMKKKQKIIEDEAQADNDCKWDADKPNTNKNNIQPTLVVRDENGKWTEEYAKVMNSMSIPTN